MASTQGGIEVIDLTGSDSDENENPLLQHLSRAIDEHQAEVLAMPTPTHHRSLEIRTRVYKPNPPQDPTLLHDLSAVSPMQQTESAPQSAPYAAVMDWLHGDRVAKDGPTLDNEEDWEDVTMQEDFVLLDSTSDDGPASRTRSRVAGRRGRKARQSAMARLARSRSPSVVFVGERQGSPGAASLPETPARITRAAAKLQKAGAASRDASLPPLASPSRAPRFLRLPNDYREIHRRAAIASARLDGALEVIEGSEELLMYTDGSYSARHGGAGVAYLKGNVWAGKAIALGSEASDAAETEIAAIYAALQLARKVLRPNQHQITIATDSGDCLARLNPTNVHGNYRGEPIVRAILEMKQQLAQEGTHVAFRWVKGHVGIEGNELADRLARFGREQGRRGLMTRIDIPDVYTKFPDLECKPLVKDAAAGERVALERLKQKKANRVAVRATSSKEVRRQLKIQLRLQRQAAERTEAVQELRLQRMAAERAAGMLQGGEDAGSAANALAGAQAVAWPPFLPGPQRLPQ